MRVNSKIFISIILVVTLFIALCACSKQSNDVLYDSLAKIYSNEANKFDFVSSHSFVVENNYDGDSMFLKTLLSILPKNFDVDLGTTLINNQNELRINGYIAGTNATVLWFKSQNIGVDLDFDLYCNVNEGIYFKSLDLLTLMKDWKPTLSPDNWLKIGDTEDAKDLINIFTKLKNQEYSKNIFAKVIKINEVKKLDTGKSYVTSIDLPVFINEIYDDNAKQRSLYKVLNLIADSISISSTYSINSDEILSQSMYNPVMTENSTSINEVFKSKSGIIYRFTYSASTEKPIKPVGEYK